MRRREFLTLGAAAPFFFAACKKSPTSKLITFSSPDYVKLTEVAINTALQAGASYADIRVSSHRAQNIFTREQRVTSVNDSEDRGFGVRVIAGGTWGFAASNLLTEAEAVRVAKEAVAMAKTNAKLQREPLKLSVEKSIKDTWKTPIEKDPFDVPLAQKVDTLLGINALALAVSGVSFCSSSMLFIREQKLFASSEQTLVEQTLYRSYPSFNVTAVGPLKGFQTLSSYLGPQGMGYECVDQYDWKEAAKQAGQEVIEKLSAPSVAPGKRDLILHPSHLWLTIHESIGHPTELDRALGMEANYAGTSFLTTEKLGSFRVGSDIVNVVADRTQKNALATCAYDDDGVKTNAWHILKEGVFVDYQTTRDQAHLINRNKSYGCSYSQNWRDVPFQRMPNVSLLPGKKPLSLSQLIADTEDAILIKGNGSFSIDHQRYNFQFGGQTFFEIKKGKITGMLKDVAYQAKTPDFWQACDAICSEDEYLLGGSFYDGKGEPSQSNAVSHGCAPSRFRQINVLNTGSSGKSAGAMEEDSSFEMEGL
jgi:TldD protein